MQEHTCHSLSIVATILFSPVRWVGGSSKGGGVNIDVSVTVNAAVETGEASG